MLPRIPKLSNPDAEKIKPIVKLPDGRRAYKVFTSARGIGDCVVAWNAICGAAEANPNCEFWFQTHHQAWLSHTSHPRIRILPDDNVGADCNVDYHLQKQIWRDGICASRAQWYADSIARFYGFEPFKPLVKPIPPSPRQPEIIVSPFSNEEARTWSLVNWSPVISKLLRDGYDVRLMGSREQHPRIRSAISTSLRDKIIWDFGKHPSSCLSTISKASYLIGNDSGLAHIAGLLGVPFLVIAADYDPRFVFPPVHAFDWVGRENGTMYESLSKITPLMVNEAFDRLASSFSAPLQFDTRLRPSSDPQRTDQSRS